MAKISGLKRDIRFLFIIKNMQKIFGNLLSLIFFPLFINGIQVTINNLKPRYDINGEIIDAHDGSIQQFEKNGLYYMHAMQYGLCQEPPNYGCDGVSFKLRKFIEIFVK